MLIKVIKPGSVVCCKLIAEEIIGRCISYNEDTKELVLERVRSAALQQNPDGGMGLMLLPWTACSIDGKHAINTSNLAAAPYLADEEIEKIYVSQTSLIKQL